MGEKSGLWGLLAAACAVTGLVVLAGFFVTPQNDRAQLSAVALHPPEGSLAPSQSALPTTELVAAPRIGRAVTLTKRPKPKILPPPTLDFTISSFNVLGSSHTRSGGTHARFGPGPERARRAASLVLSHGVEVVGFQEMQADQLASFQRATGGRFAAYPGFELGRLNTENSIAWRTDTWQLVEKRPVSIPYFRGHQRLMPVVRLRNPATGIEAWFANFHNPADTRQWGHNQHWRTVATGKEILIANQLRAETGLPVFITGDMNERAEYFCAMTGGTDLEAALGGSNDGACHPPRIRYVDWIFGSQDVTFSGYLEDASQFVRHTSDHPMIVSEAHLVGKPASPTASASPSPQ